MGIYWPEDRIDDVFGSVYPPVNGVEVCREANRLIDEYISENPDANESDINDYSAQLWEDVCMKDKIGNVDVIWE